MWIKQAYYFLFSTGYPQKVEKLRKQDFYTHSMKKIFLYGMFLNLYLISPEKNGSI